MINVVPILNITRSDNKWEFFKVSLQISAVFASLHAAACHLVFGRW